MFDYYCCGRLFSSGPYEVAVQSAHTGFIPRVGGLAIYLSIFSLIPILSFGFIPLSLVFDLNVKELSWLILSAAPVFLVGIIEDLGYSMSPKARIFASIISSFVALLFFKVWLSNLGIFGLDTLLMFAPLGIIFTIFSTVGVVNAFNLIDGLNGFPVMYLYLLPLVNNCLVNNFQITIF